MSDVLRLERLEKSYNRGKPGEIAVLKGIDLVIPRGQVVALVAPSGAGKSTLLHIAGLLDTPDAGRVVLGGEDLSGAGDRRRTEARRNELGFVYQFHHLLPEFSAEENVVLPQLANGVARGAARARAQELLGRVGLSGRRAHRPSAMSGRSSAWPSAGRWPMRRACSWPMSRPGTWIRAHRTRYSGC